MKRRIMAALRCALLAGLMLYASGAAADMLLFATAGDCTAADLTDRTLDAPHAVILQAAKAADEKAARKALKEAGVEEVEFLKFSVAKPSITAETLEKLWAKKENTARVVSLLRRFGDDRIIYYAGSERDRTFLSAFAERCAAGANDPECRMEKKATDEYLREVSLLIDGTTDEERKTPAAGTAWRETWEDGAEYNLSALPETDEEGFLPEGEYILEDEGQKLWVYLSPALRVTVTGHRTDGYSWFEADIRRRPEGETLHVIGSLNGRGNDPAKVAEENGLVIGTNADYYQIRVSMKKKTGLIIRNGELVREAPGKADNRFLPPLDTLLLDASGGFRLDKVGELDSEKAFALGAVDVLAFGPILVKNGRIRIQNKAYWSRKEPRTAVGLIGENHYLMVVAEGRLPQAKGMTLNQLAQLMAARGCTEAFNLDGGHTSALIFMGKRLNRIGNLSGTGTTVPRNMAELLGIGTHGQ